MSTSVSENRTDYTRILAVWERYQRLSVPDRTQALRRILRSSGEFSPAWAWIFRPDPQAAQRLQARYERQCLAEWQECSSPQREAGWREAVRQDWLYAGSDPLLSTAWEEYFGGVQAVPSLSVALGPEAGLWRPEEQLWRLSVPYLAPDRYGRPAPPPPFPHRCQERFRRLWILSGSWRLPVHREAWLRALDLVWEPEALVFYFSLPAGQAPEPWVSFGLRLRLSHEWPGLGQDPTCLTSAGLYRVLPVLEPRAWHLESLSGPSAALTTVRYTAESWLSAPISAVHTGLDGGRRFPG